jgi:hypothetical protein
MPKTLEADDINQFYTAITGDFLPRNVSSGAIETETHSLGVASTQWKNIYGQNLFLNGVLFDPENIGSGGDSANAIVSGATRSGSEQPDFIRASGSGASCTILATATPLQITANSISITIEADIPVTSLTLAPSSNNTCLINDAALAGGAATLYTGEHESDPITIDTVGTEISDRIGQYICLKRSTEYMLAFVESATKLRHVMRGFFFDSAGAPIVRQAISNNDSLTIMSLGWVFMDANGTTVDVSYKSPSFSYTEPASPDADDYWFDQENRVWNRYNGSDFVAVNRILIGLVVIDTADCVASRSFDFSKSFSDLIEIECELQSVTQARSKSFRNLISVYGQRREFNAGPIVWDITNDLETGLIEANSTVYYLYITEKGAAKISTERPYNRLGDLRGWYHPYHSWRYAGVAYNGSGGDLTFVNSHNSDEARIDIFTSSSSFLAIPNKKIKATITGGGGGGGGVAGGAGGGGTGGSSSFSGVTAAGGAGGTQGTSASVAGGAGGAASGGDLNFSGSAGGAGDRDSFISGFGGPSIYGGSPKGVISNGAGTTGGARGAGGSGGASTSSTHAASGGGSGATAIKLFYLMSGLIPVTIGGAGAAGSGSTGGGAGVAGLITLEYL